MTTQMPSPVATPEELAGRLLESTVGAMDVLSVYLGEQLGYYRALQEGGPATSAELASRTGTHERYTREWLEQQATTGILSVEVASTAEERSFALPNGYGAVLVDPVSDLFVAPVGRFIAAMMTRHEDLLEAYRSGAGVPWGRFGAAASTAQSDFNRPFFLNSLVSDYLVRVPGLEEALARPGARIAEIGAGGGWASMAIARGFAQANVDGFDIDAPSVEMAKSNLAGSGVEDRVTFHLRDAGDPALVGQYDLVCAFECIHDLPDPVSVLRTMRRLATSEGTILVMDERVGETFGAVGDFNERLFYGFSIGLCLADGMSHKPSVGTGTVMRPATLEKYAREAGFSGIEVLPLDHDLFRFYRLVR